MKWVVIFITVFADSSFANSCFSAKLCPPVPFCDSHAWSKWQCWSLPHKKCSIDVDKQRVLRVLSQHLRPFKGQDDVIQKIKAFITLKLEHPDKRVNLHFAGDNGVGKTSIARLVSSALFMRSSQTFSDAGDGFVQLDTEQYSHLSESSSAQDVAAARADLLRQIKDAVSWCSRAVILVDELETLFPPLALALIPALKGNPVGGTPTKEAMFILTSDFGKEGASRGLSSEALRQEVYRFSASLYTADLNLVRHVTILPFFPLLQKDFEDVVATRLSLLPCKLPALHCVVWDIAVEEAVSQAAWNGLREKNGREVDEKFDILIHGPLAVALAHRLPGSRVNATLVLEGPRVVASLQRVSSDAHSQEL